MALHITSNRLVGSIRRDCKCSNRTTGLIPYREANCTSECTIDAVSQTRHTSQETRKDTNKQWNQIQMVVAMYAGESWDFKLELRVPSDAAVLLDANSEYSQLLSRFKVMTRMDKATWILLVVLALCGVLACVQASWWPAWWVGWFLKNVWL